MARRKRKSPLIEKAKLRAVALASISPTLDLGGEVTLPAYKAATSIAEAKLDAYNTKLSELDHYLNELVAQETKIRDWTERMLAGVAAKFGKNSSEYEKAGGTRKSEHKKRTPKAKPATPAGEA